MKFLPKGFRHETYFVHHRGDERLKVWREWVYLKGRRRQNGPGGLLLILFFLLIGVKSCPAEAMAESDAGATDTGVLLISHGSKSKNWRQQLWQLQDEVATTLQAEYPGARVRSAFMESARPSIAEQLRAFDQANVARVLAIPVFLTVGGHATHDIPNLLGLTLDPEIRAHLAEEGLDIYRAQARVTLLPTLDYTRFLQGNVLRRVRALSQDPAQEGLVLVAYGSSQYAAQWTALMEDIARHVRQQTGMPAASYTWCGHVVDYSPLATREAIEAVLTQADSAIVIPVLVSNNPRFQDEIIQQAVDSSRQPERVRYVQDAILPDPALTDWIVEAVRAAW